MSDAKQPRRTNVAVIGRILFNVAMFIAILLGVHHGYAVLIPVDWCAGTPVDPIAYVLNTIFALYLADPRNRSSFWPIIRSGVTILVGVSLAVPTARLAAGCTSVGEWAEAGRSSVEALVLLGILISLAALHVNVIEPRWTSHKESTGKV